MTAEISVSIYWLIFAVNEAFELEHHLLFLSQMARQLKNFNTRWLFVSFQQLKYEYTVTAKLRAQS